MSGRVLALLRISRRWLGRRGSRCWARTIGAGTSSGSVPTRVASACIPPADQPMTTRLEIGSARVGSRAFDERAICSPRSTSCMHEVVSAPIVGERVRVPNVVALGASAGGIEPLLAIVGGLREDLEAAVLIVVHVPSSGKSALPRILGRHTRLPVAHATDGEALRAGRILIAPPDHHLTIEDSTVVVRRGPVVNRARPAIDPLFQSVALHARERGIGVVLSGALDDGAAGLAAIAQAGGVAIVQDPN